MTVFVARLGTRALAPPEAYSSWGIADYVAAAVPGEADNSRLEELRTRLREQRRTDPERVLALLAALAGAPMAEVNLARVAREAGIPVTTLPPYVDLLVDLGLIRLLPGATSSVAKRAVARPRVVLADPALAYRLSRIARAELLEVSGRRRLRPLLLNLVVNQLIDQAGDSSVPYRLSHLRERNGLHVDLLIELDDESLYAVEVRTASSFRPHQFRSLEALAARAGARLRAGIVLHTAPRGHVFRPGMWALPLSVLWGSDHSVDLAGGPRRK
ncbi:DUF4143 domain-containing protein [Nocardioides sp. zg-ZUI104]|uniref:DUF4143 domain-containing protein n=1 Tax=Nocardioides faecalis TaxID=2803858 RepID=UPI001BCF8B31|nr:DUF4143 domain-containing protein [Nocardioides faecalis]MBS4753309.1 DUF4143 domain-containing protein [Nocardioides faecalis]